MEHEVDFWKYCKTCRHLETEESEEPCCDCLEEPVNIDSRKPVKYEARDISVKKVKKRERKRPD